MTVMRTANVKRRGCVGLARNCRKAVASGWLAVVVPFVFFASTGTTIAGEDHEVRVIDAGKKIALEVPYSVRYLATGGYWEHGGDYGTHRVVVVTQGQEHAQAYTYIQWILLSGPAEKRGDVIETMSVDELNRSAALIVSAVEFRGGAEDPSASLRMIDRATKEEREGTLQLSTPGIYRFKMEK